MLPSNNIPTNFELIFLGSRGFTQLFPGKWLFSREGIVFDLSAANLDLIEKIWAEKLFVIGE